MTLMLGPFSLTPEYPPTPFDLISPSCKTRAMSHAPYQGIISLSRDGGQPGEQTAASRAPGAPSRTQSGRCQRPSVGAGTFGCCAYLQKAHMTWRGVVRGTQIPGWVRQEVTDSPSPKSVTPPFSFYFFDRASLTKCCFELGAPSPLSPGTQSF